MDLADHAPPAGEDTIDQDLLKAERHGRPDDRGGARASLAWRTVDADLLLAELAFDSGYDETDVDEAGNFVLRSLT